MVNNISDNAQHDLKIHAPAQAITLITGAVLTKSHFPYDTFSMLIIATVTVWLLRSMLYRKLDIQLRKSPKKNGLIFALAGVGMAGLAFILPPFLPEDNARFFTTEVILGLSVVTLAQLGSFYGHRTLWNAPILIILCGLLSYELGGMLNFSVLETWALSSAYVMFGKYLLWIVFYVIVIYSESSDARSKYKNSPEGIKEAKHKKYAKEQDEFYEWKKKLQREEEAREAEKWH